MKKYIPYKQLKELMKDPLIRAIFEDRYKYIMKRYTIGKNKGFSIKLRDIAE